MACFYRRGHACSLPRYLLVIQLFNIHQYAVQSMSLANQPFFFLFYQSKLQNSTGRTEFIRNTLFEVGKSLLDTRLEVLALVLELLV